MEPRLQMNTVTNVSSIIGVSPAAEEMRLFMERVAPTNLHVLLLGETGTGKGLLARCMHDLCGNARPFVEVDCGAIPRELVETELFGCARGAFTGALRDKEGLVEEAEGGTLFLDEIHNLPYDLQGKLLKLVQSRSYRKVGEVRERRVSARIIAGTNVDLERAMQEGEFRSDLFYRLNVMPHQIPPLRERPEDILPLAEHFLDQQRSTKQLSSEARKVITSYPWPGNVRELESIITRGMVLADSGIIDVQHLKLPLPPEIDKNGESEETLWVGRPLPSLQRVKMLYLQKLLNSQKGNVTKAARIAGINRNRFYDYIKNGVMCRPERDIES